MSSEGPARWTLWLFRIAVTLAAVLTFTKAVLAGTGTVVAGDGQSRHPGGRRDEQA